MIPAVIAELSDLLDEYDARRDKDEDPFCDDVDFTETFLDKVRETVETRRFS